MIYIGIYIVMFLFCLLTGFRRKDLPALYSSTGRIPYKQLGEPIVHANVIITSARKTADMPFPYWFFLIFLFFFCAFRWDVGCDFRSYENHFLHKAWFMDFTDALSVSEPAYWATQIWLREIGLNWAWINVLSAIVFFMGIHALARRQPNPLMFLTLCFPALIIGVAMSAIRQAAAIGFLCFAFNAFVDNKWIRYAVLVFIAAMFHKSAVVFLAAASFIMPIQGRMKFMIGALTLIPSFLILSGSETYESYSSVYVGTQNDAAGGIFRVLPISISGIFYILYLRKRWRTACPGDAYFIDIFAYPLVMIVPLVLYSSVMGDRFGYYLSLVAFMIQVRAYLLYSNRAAQLVFFIPLAAGMVLLVVWSQLSAAFWECYLPYQTWLDR
jgi:hypothetical protein